ncbi:MAG: hypothetical protein ACLFPS_09145 [Clostridia bacterium]
MKGKIMTDRMIKKKKQQTGEAEQKNTYSIPKTIYQVPDGQYQLTIQHVKVNEEENEFTLVLEAMLEEDRKLVLFKTYTAEHFSFSNLLKNLDVLDQNYTFNKNDLIGKKVAAKVENRTKAGKTYSNVIKIIA